MLVVMDYVKKIMFHMKKKYRRGKIRFMLNYKHVVKVAS